MVVCNVCEKNSMLPETYGSLTLCKKCSLKIQSPSWKSKAYTSNDEVEEQKKSTLGKAVRAGFPQTALDHLSAYFDGMKISGLVKSFDGGADQTLVVFDSSCVIETEEDFDYEEIREAYYLIVSGQRGNSRTDDESVTEEMLSSAAESFMSGFMRGGVKGGVAKAGVSLVTDVVTKSSTTHMTEKSLATKKTAASQVALNVTYGKKTLRYADCREVLLFMPADGEEYGFIRFQKGEAPSSKDMLFFFDGSSERRAREAMKLHGFIHDKVEENAEKRAEAVQQEERKKREAEEAVTAAALQASAVGPRASAPDEVLKWKQLLDAGAITQQEYDAKKAQLLGL